MKLLLAILALFPLLAPVLAGAAEIPLAWDPSPTAGVTNYSLHVGTNSLTSGNTNWLAKHVGTNLTAKLQVEGATRLYIHARAWLDGVMSDPSNEIQVQVPAPPPNLRTLVLTAFADLSNTNHTGQAFIQVKFLP